MKCKRTSDGRSYDHHTLQVMRRQAIKAVHEGRTVSSVAAALGVNERSVFRWLASFADGGQNALLAKPIPGRPSKLSREKMAWIAREMRENTPQQQGFESGLWTLGLIRRLIERQFGVTLSTATAHQMMKTLGLRVRKPLLQDPVQARTWKTNISPAIVAEARGAAAIIYIMNESEVHSDYYTGTTKTPKDTTSVATIKSQQLSLSMLSAINPRGEIHFMLHDGTVTAIVFLEFLDRLLLGAQRPVFLIVNRRRFQCSQMVRTYADNSGGKLRLFFLP